MQYEGMEGTPRVGDIDWRGTELAEGVSWGTCRSRSTSTGEIRCCAVSNLVWWFRLDGDLNCGFFWGGIVMYRY